MVAAYYQYPDKIFTTFSLPMQEDLNSLKLSFVR